MSKTCEQSRSEITANLIKFLDVTEVIMNEKVPDALRQLWCSKIADLAQLPDHGAAITVRIKVLHDGLKKTVAPQKTPSDPSTVFAPAAATGSNVMEVEPAEPLSSPVPQAAPVRSRPSSAPGAFGAKTLLYSGTRVLAKRLPGSNAYAAVIASVNADGTYDLNYDDGSQEKGVAKHLIQRESPLASFKASITIPPPPLPSFPKGTRAITQYKPRPSQAFKNGTRVNVRLQNGKRFAGVIKRQVRVGIYSVILETGRTMEVDSSQLNIRIRPTAPPPTEHAGWKCALKVGMPVVAKWKGSYKMWSAKIVAVNADGTFSLHYDDGDKDQRVSRASICAKLPPKTGHSSHATHSRYTLVP